MATLNFPDDPTTGDEYYDSNAGFNYEWNGTVWITKNLATPDNTREIDDISSGFDGSDTTFTLKVEGVNIVPQDVKQLVISVGGVMQNPGDDYTVSGSTLTFTTAPLSGLSFVGTFLGVAASLNTITAGTVSPSSLTATSNYTVGSIKVSGASTIGNFVLTGLTTITDPDVTNLNSSGVGTVSNVIITGDNSGLGATVGSAVGVVTYFGDGSNMTGVGLSIFPLVYGPGIGSTDQSTTTDITTTWNYPIQAGSGTITIRTGSGSGTIVDQFVVGSSSSITISERTLTLNPAADLDTGTEHFVVYPAGAIKSTSGQKENNQLVTSFTTITNSLFSWGDNNEGQLAQNDRTSRSSPTQVAGSTWSSVMMPGTSVYGGAHKSDGTLWVWGDNQGGGLGLGPVGPNNISQSSPVQLGTETTWTSQFFIALSSGATKTDGTLWAWGSNYSGALGLNQDTPSNAGYSSPMQVGTDTTWSKFSAGDSGYTARFGIKTDGTLWAWGRGTYGELGLSSQQMKSSPTQLPGTTWSVVRATSEKAIATKTDGSLWMWGTNEWGELGQNSRTDYSSPKQIPGTWNIGEETISIGSGRVQGAIKTDGSLWTWGANFSGALGQNAAYPAASYSSPVQVGTDTTWSKFAIAGTTSLAIKTDGTAWGWGNNPSGHLGLNNTISLSSPTQIPGTWTTISGWSDGFSMGIKQG